MNLRNVTIWTTGVMMILVAIVPAGLIALLGYGDAIVSSLILWLFSGTPLLVSFALAVKLEYKISTIILLLSAIAYGLWFVQIASNVVSMVSSTHLNCNCGLELLFFLTIGPLSLPVMLPVWITALVLNWRYAQKQEPQV